MTMLRIFGKHYLAVRILISLAMLVVPASAGELTPERRQQFEDEIARQMDSSSVRFINDEFYWIGFRGRNPDYKEFQILRASKSQTGTFQVTCEKDGFTVTAYKKSLEPLGDSGAKADPETAEILISGRALVFAPEFVTRGTNSILIVGRTSPDEMPGKAVVEAVIAGVESFTVLEKTSGERMEFLSGGLDTTAAKQFHDACYRG